MLEETLHSLPQTFLLLNEKINGSFIAQFCNNVHIVTGNQSDRLFISKELEITFHMRYDHVRCIKNKEMFLNEQNLTGNILFITGQHKKWDKNSCCKFAHAVV